MNILLKSAKIVNAHSKDLHLKRRDILIQDGFITKIGANLDAPENAQVVAHKNLHASLGWVDTGICIGEPGFEERETIDNGLQTAAKSGFTDVFLNPTSYPSPDTSSDIVFLKNAAKNHLTNLHPLANLTVAGKGQTLAEMYDMKNAGALGFYDYKAPISNANLLKIALQYAQNFQGTVFSFPMDKNISGKGVVNEGETSTQLGLKGIPALAEEIQVARDLLVLEYTGGRLHIPTISTQKTVKLIADAKKRGLQVTCSAAIHNLGFTDTNLEGFDTHFKVIPPLRSHEDVKALIKGVTNGTIDFVTTDHTPLNIELKQVEFDNAEYGTTGLESAFGMLLTIFDLEQTIDLLTRGRDEFGLPSATMEEGKPACLTLFDPMDSYEFQPSHIHSTNKNSLFLGTTLKGKVLGSLNNNKMVLNL
jgi:dihydroorotase